MGYEVTLTVCDDGAIVCRAVPFSSARLVVQSHVFKNWADLFDYGFCVSVYDTLHVRMWNSTRSTLVSKEN